jgi:uncharacterized RDD family membrane protein YckC
MSDDFSQDWAAPEPVEPSDNVFSRPPVDALNASFGHEPEVLAGFWIRLIAHLCDNIMAGLVTLPFSIVSSSLSKGSAAAGLVSYLGLTVSFLVYAYWIGVQGGSPLRRRMGVLVLDAQDSSFIGMPRACVRILVSYLSGIVIGLGYFWMLWDGNKQTWHDKAARSVVVRR